MQNSHDDKRRQDVEAGIRTRERLDRIVGVCYNARYSEGQAASSHCALVLDLLQGAGQEIPGWEWGKMTRELGGGEVGQVRMKKGRK